MRVWIDQDLCTGDGLCVDHCHEVFTLLEDGIAYVIEDGTVLNDPGGSSSIAAVRLARPNLPAGSSALPARTTRFTCTSGTSCDSMIQTGSPLPSVRFWMAGTFSAGAGPGTGGFERSGACARRSATGR